MSEESEPHDREIKDEMTTIHIKATQDTDDKLISELMNILIKYGFKTEKYLGLTSKIVMGKIDLK